MTDGNLDVLETLKYEFEDIVYGYLIKYFLLLYLKQKISMMTYNNVL